MRAIAPRTGAIETTIAEEQPEYMPITVALYQYADGSCGIVTRWQPSAEERAAILAGEDIYVNQIHFGKHMTPLMVRVGPGDFTVRE